MSWREPYRGCRVLVLGATGFIGRRVARQLADAGADSHLAVRDVTRARAFTGPLHEIDLARAGSAAALVRTLRPAITFNLTGYGVDPAESDAALAERLNHELVIELAVACGAEPAEGWTGQRLVHAGSAAEYGDAGGKLAEAGAVRPLSLYGRSKLHGTESLTAAARSGGLRALTARLFTVYGPGERAGRLLPSLLEAARTGGSLALTEGIQRRDFTFVDDVAEGMLRLGALPQAGVGPVNLATGVLESVRGFAERAARVLGIPAGRLQFGARPGRPDEMEHDPVDLTRLRSLTGWAPETSIESGVRQTLEVG